MKFHPGETVASGGPATITIGGKSLSPDAQVSAPVHHVTTEGNRNPLRVVPPTLTRREYRDFQKRYRKLAKKARCHGVKPASYDVSVLGKETQP